MYLFPSLVLTEQNFKVYNDNNNNNNNNNIIIIIMLLLLLLLLLLLFHLIKNPLSESKQESLVNQRVISDKLKVYGHLRHLNAGVLPAVI